MILVTGGTGLVGAHLLYHLLQEHPKVRATHRKSSDLLSVQTVFLSYTDAPEAVYNRIEWVEANLTDLPALTQAFEGIAQVYHCAAFISFNPKHYQALKKANIEGTANVVNLCLHFQVEKLCYVSSIATLGHPVEATAFMDEHSAWNPEDRNSVYAITKYGAEMEVWRGSQEGLKVVIVNPGVILGEGYWNSGSGVIVKRAAKGVRYFTDGSTGFVDVRDVVSMMIGLMKSNIHNEQFVLVAENLSYARLLELFSNAFGKLAPKKKASKMLLMALSTLDGWSSKLFGTKRRLLKATVRSLFTHSNYSSSKIQTALGANFTPIDLTIKRVASAYQKDQS
ncbi:MAG: NAD-dependent epimerase/dehydratase family protein [Flavobacteriaceae bacterium]